MPSLSPEEEKTPDVAAENLLRQQEGENEDQILILTMQKYLTNDDWIAVMRKYMDLHASTFIFAEEECFTQAHFDVFREFQGIAEAALESMLLSLNCNNEKFVCLIEGYSIQPLKGPIDAALKELTKALLALNDFKAFAELMASRAEDLRLKADNNASAAALSKGGDRTKEEAKAEGPPSSSSKRNNSSNNNDNSTARSLGIIAQEDWNNAGDYQIDHKDWQDQLVTAHAIMEGYEARVLCDQDEIFVAWAMAALEFTEAVRNKEGDDKLSVLTMRLLRERCRVDMVVAQRMARAMRSEGYGQMTDLPQLKSEESRLIQAVTEAHAETMRWISGDLKQTHVYHLAGLLQERCWRGGDEPTDVGPICDFVFDYLYDYVPFDKHGLAVSMVTWLEWDDMLRKLLITIRALKQKEVEQQEKERARKKGEEEESKAAEATSSSHSIPVSPAFQATPDPYAIDVVGRSGQVYRRGSRELQRPPTLKGNLAIDTEAKQALNRRDSSEAKQNGRRNSGGVGSNSTSTFRPPVLAIPTTMRHATREVGSTTSRAPATARGGQGGGGRGLHNQSFASGLVGLLSPTAVSYLKGRTPR